MLSFQTEGQGNPVVLLHAFPLSSRMWKAQIKILSSFSKVIAPDLPGFGNSERLSSPSIAVMARQVSELLDELKISGPVFMGGLSMGGYAAFEFFRQFPTRVRGLGFFSTRATQDSEESRQKRMSAIEAIQKEGLEPFAAKTMGNLFGATTLKKNPPLVKEIQQEILKNSKEGIMDALKAMAARSDSTPLLNQISVPALVLAGAEDRLISKDEAEAMSRAIPKSEVRILPASGHLINLEAEDLFNRELALFLRHRIFQSGV